MVKLFDKPDIVTTLILSIWVKSKSGQMTYISESANIIHLSADDLVAPMSKRAYLEFQQIIIEYNRFLAKLQGELKKD